MFEELEKYKSLEFFARQVVEGFITGLHKSPFHGFSVEFSEHRQYQPGESTRNIDWKLYARSDRLFVKRYEEETNLRCQLVVDHSSSMHFPLEGFGNLQQPNKITFSIYAAAALMELLSRQRDAFGITLVSDKIDLQTEVRSNAAHHHYLLNLLQAELTEAKAHAKEPKPTSIAESLHLTAERLHQRSLVALFTDSLIRDSEWDPMLDALRHLRHNKHEVILFHTLDYPHELQFDYGLRPTEFIDLESGTRLKLQPEEVAARYREIMERQLAELKQRTMQYHIEFVPVDISKGFEQVLLPFLLKRQRKM